MRAFYCSFYQLTSGITSVLWRQIQGLAEYLQDSIIWLLLSIIICLHKSCSANTDEHGNLGNCGTILGTLISQIADVIQGGMELKARRDGVERKERRLLDVVNLLIQLTF